MRAFVTGVTGFAGSHLAEYLLACGDEVLGCSQHAQWPRDIPEALSTRVPLLSWDLEEGVTVAARERVAEFQPEAVYHLAAISVPADCGSDTPTPAAWSTNVEGSRAIVEICRQLAQRPRVLFASSCYVYAPVTPEDPLVNEQSPIDPQRAYGQTKLAAERLFLDAADAGSVEAIVARAFQHVGPRQSPRMILPDWARQFAMGGDDPVRVVSFDTYLDLTDVRDIVRAYRQLLLDGSKGSVYNVGSGLNRRSGDLFEVMRRLAGPDRTVVELEPGLRQHPIADYSRLASQTGWRPEIPIEQTINDTVSYWRERGRGS